MVHGYVEIAGEFPSWESELMPFDTIDHHFLAASYKFERCYSVLLGLAVCFF